LPAEAGGVHLAPLAAGGLVACTPGLAEVGDLPDGFEVPLGTWVPVGPGVPVPVRPDGVPPAGAPAPPVGVAWGVSVGSVPYCTLGPTASHGSTTSQPASSFSASLSALPSGCSRPTFRL
jgi:hypothetical protein